MTKTSSRPPAGNGCPRLSARAAALLLAAAAGFGIAGSLGLVIEKDITALLCAGDAEGSSLVRLAREWGMMGRVAIAVGPGEPGSDALLAATEAVAAAVAGVEGVESVTWRTDPEAGRRAAELLMDRAFLLGGPGIGDLDREEVARRLESVKERLASPEAIVFGRYLLADPLGLAREALSALEAGGRFMGARVERGHLVSAGGDRALVFVELGFDPLDVERAGRFVKELDRAVADGLARAGAEELSPIVLGGAHFAAASGAAIIRDVRRAFALTACGVLAVFLLFFRRLRFLPVALVPGGAGIAVAMGIFGLAGVPLHALTLGFAATITGVSVDYAIHLLHRSWHAPGADSAARMSAALAATIKPMTLGCVTTVAAFLLVATSAVPGMRQLAVFASISIPVALAVTVLVLPAFHAVILGGAPGRQGIADRMALRVAAVSAPDPAGGGRLRSAVLAAGFAVVAAVGVFLGLGAPRSGDPRDLGYRDPDLAMREEMLARVFPGLADQAILVASGADLEQALTVNDRAYRELPRFGVGPGRVVSVAPFLPARETQRASLAAAGRLLRDRETADAFAEAGFAQQYLEGLERRLEAGFLVLDDLAGTALERAAAEAIHRHGGRWHVLTRARIGGDEDLDALAALAAAVDGLELVSERIDTRRVLEAMMADLGRMLGIWLVLAFAIIGALHRSLWVGVRSALPAIFGVAVAGGVFGLLGRPVTPVAGAGLTLVLGLGIDYGLFVGHALGRRQAAVAPAVAASALTTLAAFGVLALADTRAMADLGLVILAGVGAAMIAALVLLPALQSGRARDGEETAA